LLQGFISPWLLCGCHAKHIQSTVPTVSQVGLTTKNKNFPLNHSLACANYAIYAAIHACIVYLRKAEKIGKVMMRRVENKHRKQNP